MAKFESAHGLGDTVYIKTDEQQRPCMVIGVSFRPGTCQYHIGCGPGDSWHYDIELSTEPREQPKAGFTT